MAKWIGSFLNSWLDGWLNESRDGWMYHWWMADWIDGGLDAWMTKLIDLRRLKLPPKSRLQLGNP